MTLKREVVWVFECDWLPCSQKLVVRLRLQSAALDHARVRQWSVSNVRPAGSKKASSRVRCPDHSYRWPINQVGRPRRRLGQITTLPRVRHGKCTGCGQKPDSETGACKCGTMTMPLGET